MDSSDELKKLKYSFILPFFFILILWGAKVIDLNDSLELYKFGVYPRTIRGLPGILLSPLLHSDLNHLISNSIPLLILGTGIIYFYRELAYKVVGFIWLVSGIGVWLIARDSYHIGASGLIYGIAAFLFLSGFVRKDYRLAAISLVVILFYGGLVWGVFPFFPHISWEYHLLGGISGFVAAIIYRNKGPKPIVWSWEQEDEEENEDNPNELANNMSE